MASVGIMAALNISAIRWQISDYLWSYLFNSSPLHQDANANAIICQYIITSIYYSPFFMHLETFFKYTLTFNYTLFLILLKLERITRIYVYVSVVCYLTLAVYVHFELTKLNDSMTFG